MPGARPEWSGRQPQVAGAGAASVTGRKEQSTSETERLMEEIVSRGNMMAALSKVVSNKGAPGVDDMPVTAMKGASSAEFVITQWLRQVAKCVI